MHVLVDSARKAREQAAIRVRTSIQLRTAPVLVALMFPLVSCDQSGATDTDCESYTVSPDGGVSGFTAIGEWRTGSFCLQYCEKDYTSCRQVSETAVKCRIPCG